MDAFTWSLPFVGSKITEMLLAVLAVCSEEELEGTVDDDDDARTVISTTSEVEQRRKEIKSKIMAVGKMQRIFQLLRYVVISFPNINLTINRNFSSVQ